MTTTISELGSELASDWRRARELEASAPRLAGLAHERAFTTERMLLELAPSDAGEALSLLLVLQDFVLGRPVDERQAAERGERNRLALANLVAFLEEQAGTTAEALGLGHYKRSTAAIEARPDAVEARQTARRAH
ncbi:MAG: hypothetical protein AB7O57_14825 [Hyphomicrobiaceae bacterium]